MRDIATAALLVGFIGCSTKVDLGDRVKTQALAVASYPTCDADGGCPSARCVVAANCCLAPGPTIYVDGVQGVDTNCCGGGTGPNACASISYALVLAHGTGSMPVTIAVANPPNGKDWVADQVPFTLDQGIVLSAPGLYFSGSIPLPDVPDASTELFLISNPDAGATFAPTIIEGSADAPIHLGFDSQDNQGLATRIITVRNARLNLLNAEIRPVIPPFPQEIPTGFGVFVEANSRLTLGTDGMGSSGTVLIDEVDWLGIFATWGIDCEWGATVDDEGSTASPSLWIHGVAGLIYSIGTLRLTAHPMFGYGLDDAGACVTQGPTSVVVRGFIDPPYPAPSEIDNAIFECGAGLYANAPGFRGDNDLFQWGDTGAELIGQSYFDAGTIYISNSTFRYNDNGITAAGQVDLSVGNSIFCNSVGGYPLSVGRYSGIGLYLTPPFGGVNAENILWDHWDSAAGQTQVWTCDNPAGRHPRTPSCSCTGASSCPSGAVPPAPNMDILVYVGVDAGVFTVDDANGGQAADACQ